MNLSGNSLPRREEFPQATTMELEPGAGVTLTPDSFLEDATKVALKYHLGFSASLRGVVCLGSSTEDMLYIFDRGKSPGVELFADTPTSKTNSVLRDKDRYIVMTPFALQTAKETKENNWSLKFRAGWQSFVPGETTELGRSQEGESALKHRFAATTSRRHLQMTFGDSGEIELVDLNSSNGTKLIMPNQAHLATSMDSADPDVDRTVDKSADMTAALRLGKLASKFMPNRSERESKGLEVGRAEVALHGEDTVLIDEKLQLFGIFDGVGGHNYGAEASQAASEAVLQILSSKTHSSPEQVLDVLQRAFVAAHHKVEEVGGGSGTTAAVVQLANKDGKDYAVWASVGDSRIYIYNNQTLKLVQVTEDEILGPQHANVITNALGMDRMSVRQSGMIELSVGDKLIVCSDGITGDFEPDILTSQEIAETMQKSRDNTDAANNLVRISRKRDDKSVIVVSK